MEEVASSVVLEVDEVKSSVELDSSEVLVNVGEVKLEVALKASVVAVEEEEEESDVIERDEVVDGVISSVLATLKESVLNT